MTFPKETIPCISQGKIFQARRLLAFLKEEESLYFSRKKFYFSSKKAPCIFQGRRFLVFLKEMHPCTYQAKIFLCVSQEKIYSCFYREKMSSIKVNRHRALITFENMIKFRSIL